MVKAAAESSVSDKRKALEKRGIYRPSRGGGRAALSSLLALLQREALLPAVMFAFSKRVCEDSAHSLHSVDLTTASEKSAILVFFNAAMKRLHSQDRALPQVLHVKEMVVRGLSTHHAGMLPILKEVVEILFGRGLIKLLFATETFAMGVNMPTRTVVFHSLRKHDGVAFRELTPGEYTQMAGRAGRRGKDSAGHVLVLCSDADSIPPEPTLRLVSTGRPTRLQSRFRLTYNMILNLLRQEDMKVEDMMRRSFTESKQQQSTALSALPHYTPATSPSTCTSPALSGVRPLCARWCVQEQWGDAAAVVSGGVRVGSTRGNAGTRRLLGATLLPASRCRASLRALLPHLAGLVQRRLPGVGGAAGATDEGPDEGGGGEAERRWGRRWRRVDHGPSRPRPQSSPASPLRSLPPLLPLLSPVVG